MEISYKNITKSTPKIPRMIGNTLVMCALGIQPLIVGAPNDVLTDKGKFWSSIIITLIGCIGKGFTMCFTDEETNIQSNEQQS